MAELPPIQAAIESVERERSALEAECRAFDTFREAVRTVSPDATDGYTDDSAATELLSVFRNTVMATDDYDAVYGDSLEDCLRAEFRPAIAQTLLSRDPITGRRRRDLLVGTAAAIEQRQAFIDHLDAEREALETYDRRLTSIRTAIAELPECAPGHVALEQLCVAWDAYEDLEHECEQLLEQRQRELRDPDRINPAFDRAHANNEYLYGHLDVTYPVLSAIADTIDRIDRNRKPTSHH